MIFKQFLEGYFVKFPVRRSFLYPMAWESSGLEIIGGIVFAPEDYDQKNHLGMWMLHFK